MKRSKFSLSHYKLATMDMGKLVPLTWFEAMPGDTIQHSTSALIRVSPLLAPVMHPVRVRIHHWFVPNRIIWEDWEEFITGGEDGTSTPTAPYFTPSTPAESSLYDYFGVPPVAYGGAMRFSSLPFRAYNLIFNEFYRDQDLVDPVEFHTESGAEGGAYTANNVSIQNVSWEKDYFTTARPWEAKGDTVTIPLLDEAPIKGIGKYNQNWDTGSQAVYENDGSDPTYTKYKQVNPSNDDSRFFIEGNADNDPNIYADLSAAVGVSINDLRLALAVQRYQERMGQTGSRYSEYLRYLGIRSSDARLQRPEYLGGGRQVIQFSEVLSTDGANTGEMYGHGIAAVRSNRYRRFFEEHGIVMSLMSVVPKTIYANGIERKWFREVKEDYFQRELQFIGEQEVYNKEVYSEHSSPDDVFGYQNRYDELRSLPSTIAGEFRSTLNHWHFARIFGSDPALNSTFVTSSPTKRTLASQSTDALYVMANHSVQARRMMTRYAKAKTF